MHTRIRTNGFTLMELMVVMALLGLIAVVSSSLLYGPKVIDSMSARQSAELFKTSLRLARTTAVAYGHSIRFVSLKDGGYAMLDGNGDLLQPEQRFAPGQAVEWSESSVEFFPSGMTDHSLSVLFSSGDRAWQVDVLSGSGQVLLKELSR